MVDRFLVHEDFLEKLANVTSKQFMHLILTISTVFFGNSEDQLRHPRSDVYSADQVLLSKQQIWCGRALYVVVC